MQHLRLPRVLVPLALGLSLATAPAALAHPKAHAHKHHAKRHHAKRHHTKRHSTKAHATKARATPANVTTAYATSANATTSAASGVGTTTAVLSGTVVPNGHTTTYRFDYRVARTAQLNKTGYASAGSGTSPVRVQATVTGLNAATTYQYRIAAVTSAGTTYGSVSTFNTAGGTPPPTGPPVTPILNPQTSWAPVGAMPMSDSAAAALVTHEPEVRPANAAANNYVPTNTELAAFYQSTPNYLNDPLRQYVTGRPGLTNPSTDDLIQWAAHKWGIPEDWIRAEMVQESSWNQNALGDRTTVSDPTAYPPQARIAGTSDVYQSMGVMQARWYGAGSAKSPAAGADPLRWESTAFNLDFYAHYVRWLYDGYTVGMSWVPNIYKGQPWSSIGGWFGGGGNSAAQRYITWVQNDLTNRVWAQPGF